MAFINKTAFDAMRREVERFDQLREQVIRDSREILKQSKAAIYEMHRGELKGTQALLKQAKANMVKLNKLMRSDIHLANVGAYGEAVEEYVEAACYVWFMTKKQIPTAQELGVETDMYLPGLCDMVGELVRKAINSTIKGDYKTAIMIRDVVSQLYDELMLFDWRNIPVRKKFDAIKYGLEKLEDLMLQIRAKRV
jgi:predicted translin family RNA/ssDNA-binding protein